MIKQEYSQIFYVLVVLFLFAFSSCVLPIKSKLTFDIIISLIILISGIVVGFYHIFIKKDVEKERRLIESFLLFYTFILFLLEVVGAIYYLIQKTLLYLDNFYSFVTIWGITTFIPFTFAIIRIIQERKLLNKRVMFATLMIFVLIITLIVPEIYEFLSLDPHTSVVISFSIELFYMLIFIFLATTIFTIERIIQRVFSGIILLTISILETLTLVMTYFYYLQRSNIFYNQIMLFSEILYLTLVVAYYKLIDEKFSVQSYSKVLQERDVFQHLYQSENQLLSNLFDTNQLIHHDLTSDVTVLKSFLSLFYETRDDRFLKKLETRLERIEKKIEHFANTQEILKKSYIDLQILETLHDVFPDLEINIDEGCAIQAYPFFVNFVYNIVHNSYHHNKGRNNLQVKLNVFQSDGDVIIEISDNGKGIKDEIKEKIFHKGFKSSDSTGKGLALYIIKKQIERLGGRIEVEDNIPSGVIFRIIMPKARRPEI